MVAVSPEVEQESRDRAEMWVDLLTAHATAQSAGFAVTRRAELFMRLGGLPMETVLDALGTDEAGWAARVADARASEARNRAAAAERARASEQTS